MRQRTAHIHLMQADVTALRTAATHETIREQLEIAANDLDEALHYLAFDDVNNRPSVLAIADLAIVLAASRLAKIDISLRLYGPNAHAREQL